MATALGVSAGLAGISTGAQTGNGKVIFCAEGSEGQLRLAKGGTCGGRERRIAIARRGAQGPPGELGEPGKNGRDGTDATLFTDPLHPVEPYRPEECGTTPGAFCGFSAQVFASKGEGFAPVGYRKDPGGVVHLQGVAVLVCNPTHGCSGVSGGTRIFSLPPGYRPTGGTREFSLPQCPGTGGLRFIVIDADGIVQLSESPVCETSLDGISFHP